MKTSNKSSPRNWNTHSQWYVSMTKSKGSKYHQKIAYPMIISTIKTFFHEKKIHILDVGCGNGTLYSHLKKINCKYTGVDFSEKMIRSARKLNNKNTHFVVGDITDIKLETKFDVIVSIFSLQDISDLNGTIKNIAKYTREKTKLIVFMKHPSFNIPRMSGWIYDSNRKLISKRIDIYMKEKAIPLSKKRGKINLKNTHFHRPLSIYINEISKYFIIEKMEEISDKINRRNDEIPSFVYLECSAR